MSLAVITVVSELYVATTTTISAVKGTQIDNKNREIIEKLNERVSAIQEALLASEIRISEKIVELQKDVDYVGSLLLIQPRTNDELNQVLFRIHEEKIKLEQLKKELRVGDGVPKVLLELMNATYLLNTVTLKHSTIHKFGFRGNELVVSATLLKTSPEVNIMRADFHIMA